MRAVVTVGTGPKYEPMMSRLLRYFTIPGETVFYWPTLPPSWPSHQEVPYGFKAYAIQSTIKRGATTILWCDSSITLTSLKVPQSYMKPLWELIESQGYWFSENLPYGRLDLPPHTCGEWTADSALEPLGYSREELFDIPQIIATSFGLNLNSEIGRSIFYEFLGYTEEKTAFQGPWRNDNHEASSDPRVKGHRHDQTVLSVIAHRHGCKLTTPPDWIVDGVPAGPTTILEIHR